jgi:hypothetical protein
MYYISDHKRLKYQITEFINIKHLLYTSLVSMKWLLLLGSPQNGQAALYNFQKHFLCWLHIHSFSHCGHF